LVIPESAHCGYPQLGLGATEHRFQSPYLPSSSQPR
jgi:hypothetical protein